MLPSQFSKIMRGGGAGIVGEGVFLLLGFVIVFLSVKILGTEEYGIFVLALTIMHILEVICKQGLHKGMLKQITQFYAQGMHAKANAVFRYSTVRTFLMALLICVVTVLSAGILVHFFNKDAVLRIYLITLNCMLPFTVAFALFLSALQAVGRVGRMVVLEKIYKPGATACLLALVFILSQHLALSNTVFFLLVQSIVFISVCILAYGMLRGSGISLSHPGQEFNKKEYLHFSYPLLFQGIIGLVTTWTSTLMIAYFIINPQEIGAFNIIFKISSFCVIALMSLDRAFAPVIGELYYKNAQEDLLKTYRNVTRLSLTGAFLVFAAIVFLGKDALRLFDESYIASYIPLIILCIGRVVDASVGSVAYILLMTGRSKIILFNSIITLTINIILNYLLIPRFGLWGAALATAISYSLKNVIWMLFVYWKLRLHPYDKGYFKTIFIFSGCFAVAVLFKYFLPAHWIAATFNLVTFFCLFGLTYFWWGLDDDDRVIFRIVGNRLGINSR